MDNDLSSFMRKMGEPFTMTVKGHQIVVDALFSLNRMEQYLEFTDAGNDFITAVAKLAYSICTEESDDETKLSESDFLNLSEGELEEFATVLYKQVIDSEKESEFYTGDDIFKALYEKSNGLRMQMAETARKFIAPFIRTQEQISKMGMAFDTISRFDSMIPKFGSDNISKALGLISDVNIHNSAFYRASHDMDKISSAIGNIFVNIMISPGVVSALEEAASRIENIINPLRNILTSISENFFNPLRDIWATIDFDEVHRSLLDRERKGIEQILFETKWFMFSADIAIGAFILDVVDVLQNKRIRNYSKHIDAIVFKFVTPDAIDDIGRDWKLRKLSKHIKRVLHESIRAYKRREYA